MDSFSPAGHSHPRIEEFLPDYDFNASYDIRVQAPAGVLYERLLRLDINKLWLIRLLMMLRTAKRPARKPVLDNLRQRVEGTGFVVLTEIPNQELVMGVAGRFWRPDGGRCMGLTADDFAAFSDPGYAKAAWNFRLQADSPRSTVLSTETRIKCLGRAARWKFRIYWTLVGPFSGLMRKAILKQAKADAELAFEGDS